MGLPAGAVLLERDSDDVGSEMLGRKIPERIGAVIMADVFEDASRVVGESTPISGRLRRGCKTSDEAIERWRAHPSRLLRPMLHIWIEQQSTVEDILQKSDRDLPFGKKTKESRLF